MQLIDYIDWSGPIILGINIIPQAWIILKSDKPANITALMFGMWLVTDIIKIVEFTVCAYHPDIVIAYGLDTLFLLVVLFYLVRGRFKSGGTA